jgi:hypothetical protein
VFDGAYEPLDAGPDVCAFTRGGELVVAVPLRPDARFEPPPGARDVLGGAGLGSCCSTHADGFAPLRRPRPLSL